jgi:hypothetical protein
MDATAGPGRNRNDRFGAKRLKAALETFRPAQRSFRFSKGPRPTSPSRLRRFVYLRAEANAPGRIVADEDRRRRPSKERNVNPATSTVAWATMVQLTPRRVAYRERKIT